MRCYPDEWEAELRRARKRAAGEAYKPSRSGSVAATQPPFRPASASDYIKWLKQHPDIRPGSFRCAPISKAGFVVAARDFRTYGEVGPDARTIIVPSGVRHLGGELGDNILLTSDTDPPPKFGVPLFSDLEFIEAEFRADALRLIEESGVPVDELRRTWSAWRRGTAFGVGLPTFAGHRELRDYYEYLAGNVFPSQKHRPPAESSTKAGAEKAQRPAQRPDPLPDSTSPRPVAAPRRAPVAPPRTVLGVDPNDAIGVAAILSLAVVAAALSHEAALVALAALALAALLVIGMPVARRVLGRRREARELAAGIGAEWDAACVARDGVTARWTEFLFPSGADELVSSYIERPLLGDMSEPLSSAFIEAFNEMNALHTDDPRVRADRARLDAFGAAVRAAETAFAAADDNARSKALRGVASGGHQMTEGERRHVERAGALIRQALGSDSPAESRAALAKAAELLSAVGFVRAAELPEAATACIEGAKAREAISRRFDELSARPDANTGS